MTSLDNPVTLTTRGILCGIKDILPIAVFVVPFGIAFGIAAGEAGLAPQMATAMSALVFAGAAQFAALEFWSSPIAWLPLLLVVFAVNARHILLGAALYPWMRSLPAWQQQVAAIFISDANWAYAIEAHGKGSRDLGILVGSGAVMWAAWTCGTLAGAGFTDWLIDPQVFALDTLMATFFATVLVGLARGEAVLWPWLAAAAVALAATWVLPPGWHILAGGLVGGALHGR